ncbi:uncharacterized protein LOC131598609 [Vicia villosa]|uniref:uncharacterized protein LOC131598609 n=1 Tax=Vicia villosa TaxID=3911 RepID=UPI00273C0E08|nr:uncharacterized protein LOC131598609 [Vicia villosa]
MYINFPHTPILLQTENNPGGPSRHLLSLNCSDSSHKRDTSSFSKSLRMSQQSCDASPKKFSPVSDSATSNESSNPNRVLNVVPLRMISGDDVKATKPRTAHTKRPKEGIQSKGAKPSSSNTREELTKEGTKYVHNSIDRIVKRTLEENHQVPGISVPLQTIIPDPLQNINEAEVSRTSGCDPTEEEINKNGQGGAENTNVTEDDNDIEVSKDNEHTKVNAETGTKMVDLDEYPDNELPASLNTSVAKRLMTRRKGKDVSQSSPEKNAEVKSPVKNPVKKKSTSAGPIRMDVPNIPSRNKPATCNLVASIPEVPIDNVSFHYASSANGWKYVLQKRLSVERELAPNALENKEILELIQEVGLLKTLCNLPKCYERLVKEIMVNLSEDCGNSKSVDFIKVFVRDESQPELEVTDNKVCQVITAKQVKSWPPKEKLTARTKAKFDYGTYIFDQTMKHAGSFSVKGPTAFLSLLCGIILNQYPNILNEHDIACKRESPMAFHYKLFQGTHVPDVVMTSGETSKSGESASKAEVIAMLKETYKELESRKISLEKMISTLEMDGNEEFADAVEMEAEDEQEEEDIDMAHASLINKSDMGSRTLKS